MAAMLSACCGFSSLTSASNSQLQLCTPCWQSSGETQLSQHLAPCSTRSGSRYEDDLS